MVLASCSDESLELVGQVRAVFRLAARVRVPGDVVRVRQVVDAGQPRAEPLAVVDHAADGNAAETDAVVAALATDQARARAFTTCTLVGERDLERGVDRLRPRVREEDVTQSVRQPVHDVVGELERGRVPHLEGRRVFHGGDLPAHRLRDLLAAVACVDAPEPRHRVQDLPPVRRPVVHAFRAGEQARVGLELPVGRERHPEGVEVCWSESGGHQGPQCGVSSVWCPAVSRRRRCSAALRFRLTARHWTPDTFLYGVPAHDKKN
jgi:hypothetical protein